MKDRQLKQQILQSDCDNSFTATGDFGQKTPEAAAKPKYEAQRPPSNLVVYHSADISADNLVKIESSPEASQQRRKIDTLRNSVKSKKSGSKATDGVPCEGVTPPSIRVSEIDLSHKHSSARLKKGETPSNVEELQSLKQASLA